MPAPGLWSYVGASYIGVRHHVNSGNEERHEHHIGVGSVLMSMHVFAVLWMMNRMQVNAGERIRTKCMELCSLRMAEHDVLF